MQSSMSSKATQENIQILLAKQNLDLSKEYLGIAQFNKQYKKSYRGVVDTAYNAAELAAKGCLAVRYQKLPKTHKGIIVRFSEVYVKTNMVEREIGSKLARGLRYRNLSRYERQVKITKGQADEVLELADILQKFLKWLIKDSKK